MTDIRIGTSGYHYKHWVGRYYPADIKPAKMLEHYLRDFDTLELNNTFYRLPEESAFDNWRESTPREFLFSVKAAASSPMIKLKDAPVAPRNATARRLHAGPARGGERGLHGFGAR